VNRAARGLLVAALALLPRVSVAADAPPWLAQAARIAPTAIESGADAVVLLDDVSVAVADDGRITTRRTYAARILTRGGLEAASVREIYSTGSGNVRTMRGWLLNDGRVIELGRSETADIALVDNDVYNESRVKVLSAPDVFTPGIIFGAETEVVERSVFTQFEWPLQDEWPVRSVRRALTLPVGWDARAVMFNHPPIDAVRSGTTWVWGRRDLAPLPLEPAGPPLSGVVPRLAVTYIPARRDLPGFDDWPSVSRWLATLADPRAASHATLTAKTKELTASALSEIDRIRAVARYVQSVQYISIQTGIGRGGGYTPHAAIDVFTKNYGDCKDKANLMRTMLASIGLRAFLVTAYAGDPSYVRSEWPSPQQFNHAVVAVVVGAETRADAVLDHGNLGRLLFFDPTDEQTPLGELPLHLQGSQGLVVSADGGPLVRMPLANAEANPTTRRVEASVTADGTLRATVRRSSAGHPASIERQMFKGLRRDDYLRTLEADVRRQIPGAVLSLGQVGEDAATNRFELTMTLQAPGYAQIVQGRLMIVRPPQMNRLELPALTAATRLTPVVLEPVDERDILELTLPTDTAVDEMPEPRRAETSFGSFSIGWAMQNGRVTRSLSLRIHRSTVAPASYADLRNFLGTFREAERLPVILVKR
jgi:transglutaminase-like putative cysteine protease